MTDAILVDIDGTVAKIEHRLHFIQGEKRDWPAFHDACIADEPIAPVVHAVRALVMSSSANVIFVTGRPESHRSQTFSWIRKHVFEVSPPLYMRPTGPPYRPSHAVKRDLLAQIRADGFNPTIAIDDRNQDAAMYRSEGLICLQCADGDY